MTPTTQMYGFGVLLALVQVVAALPWVLALNVNEVRSWREKPSAGPLLRWAGVALVGVLLLGAAPLLFLGTRGVRETLELYGGLYAVVLHIQLSVDFFILAFALMLAVWPKGAAVALSSFREGWRQPMFWLLLLVTLFLMALYPYIPFFTFGEDYKMVKELGYDCMMLAAALFGVLAASMSISEEIEGRTAVTLMSKPVSRRQFLLGKYAGILLASLVMTATLSLFFYGMLLFKLEYIEKETIPTPAGFEGFAASLVGRWGPTAGTFLRGAAFWFGHVGLNLPGVVLGFCQVMVLLAIAVALATRLPMIVNLVICLVVFFLGHLTPVLSQVSQARFALVHFVAQLFDTLLPGLDLFNLGPAISRDTPLPSGPFAVYVGMVALYAVLYSSIALLFGLILFEDRDLA